MTEVHHMGFTFGQTPLLWSADIKSLAEYDGRTWWIGAPDCVLSPLFAILPPSCGVGTDV